MRIVRFLALVAQGGHGRERIGVCVGIDVARLALLPTDSAGGRSRCCQVPSSRPGPGSKASLYFTVTVIGSCQPISCPSRNSVRSGRNRNGRRLEWKLLVRMIEPHLHGQVILRSTCRQVCSSIDADARVHRCLRSHRRVDRFESRQDVRRWSGAMPGKRPRRRYRRASQRRRHPNLLVFVARLRQLVGYAAVGRAGPTRLLIIRLAVDRVFVDTRFHPSTSPL